MYGVAASPLMAADRAARAAAPGAALTLAIARASSAPMAIIRKPLAVDRLGSVITTYAPSQRVAPV